MIPLTNNLEDSVTKIVRCKDVGVDCDFEASGANEQEVLEKCAVHGRMAHGIQELTPELVMAVLVAMRDEVDDKP